MNTERYLAYKALRNDNKNVWPVTARTALTWLRIQSIPPLDLDWNNAGDRAELRTKTPGGLEVKVVFTVKPSEYYDTDVYGEFTSKAKPHFSPDKRIINRRLWPKVCRRNPDDTFHRPTLAKYGRSSYSRHQYEWWTAPFSSMENFRFFHNNGMNRHDALNLANRLLWEQFTDAEKERYVVDLTCKVYFEKECFASATIGDNDITSVSWREARALLDDSARQLLGQCLPEADGRADFLRSKLCHCGASP